MVDLLMADTVADRVPVGVVASWVGCMSGSEMQLCWRGAQEGALRCAYAPYENNGGGTPPVQKDVKKQKQGLNVP
jgi:hypothetical protein